MSALSNFSPRVLVKLALLALTIDCAPAVSLVVALAQASLSRQRWHCVVVPFLPLSGASQSRTRTHRGVKYPKYPATVRARTGSKSEVRAHRSDAGRDPAPVTALGQLVSLKTAEASSRSRSSSPPNDPWVGLAWASNRADKLLRVRPAPGSWPTNGC